jgi:1-acyl-sn-glycerol-3-phosphate acyltransferase
MLATIAPLTRYVAKPKVVRSDVLDALQPPVIFVANHQSHLDTALILSILPEKLRDRTAVGAGADYFFDSRLKGILSASLLGAIPIERNRVSRSSADLAIQLVSEGWNLVLFPEGGRTPDGLPRNLKAGAAQIALRTAAPLVPIFIDGTYEILGKNARYPKRGRTTVLIGDPIPPHEGEKAPALIEKVGMELEKLGNEAASSMLKRPSDNGSWFTAEKRTWVSYWKASAHRFPTDDNEKVWPKLFGSSGQVED